MVSNVQVILITGCSSGFGRELAGESLAKGLKVIATARKLESIEDLKASGAATRALDVTWPVEHLKDFASEAWQIYGRIDFLINNAGYLFSCPMEETSHEDNVAQFQTNYFGLINITNGFLPFMRQQKSGVIVNVSSQGGTIPFKSCGAYGATKAAIDQVSSVYDAELQPFNIRCVTVQPGMFRTAVFSATNLRAPAISDSYVGTGAYKDIYEFCKSIAEQAGNEPGDPKKAARYIIQVVTQEDRSKIPARLALGSDAYEGMLKVEKERLELLEQWRGMSESCNIDHDVE